MPREVCDTVAATVRGASHLEVAAGPPPLTCARLAALGRRTRSGFLERIEERIRRGVRYCDLSIPELLIDVSGIDRDARKAPPIDWPEVQEYLRRMRSWSSRDCWGSAAELVVLAHMSKTQIFLLERFACNEEWQLLTGPVGPDDWKLRIGLVYTGRHYDTVRLPFCSWDALLQQ